MGPREYPAHGNKSVKYARTFILVSDAGKFLVHSTWSVEINTTKTAYFCKMLNLAVAYYFRQMFDEEDLFSIEISKFL